MKYLVYAALAVLLVLLGWNIYRKATEPEATGMQRPGARAVAVAVESVGRKAIVDEAEFTGSLQPVSRFTVAPKVSGRLEKLLVNIGDPVRPGDLIAVLDSEEYDLQVESARAEIEVARANLTEAASNREIAAREVNRLRELRRQDVISESELDTAESMFSAAEARYAVSRALVAQREAALRTAEVRLSYTRIYVDWEGEEGTRYIAERFVDEGTLLSPNHDIVSVVDMNPVLAVIHVIESDFPSIRIGQPAILRTDAYRDRQFESRIIRRAPVVREESRQARVEVEVPNPDHLLAPGMFVRIRIRFDEQPDATVVPRSAIVQRNGAEGVFLADPETAIARFVPIRTGIADASDAQVLDPPLEGELVVTMGHHLLEDGAQIVLPEEFRAKEDPQP